MKNIKQYGNLLNEIKNRIRQAQVRAVLSVNAEMIQMYWDIGKIIYNRQQLEGWGAGVVYRLSKDLHNELPEIKGFSERNIKFMVQLYKEYEQKAIGKQAVSRLDFRKRLVSLIPWGHNILLMQKIKDQSVRFWYMEQTIQNGWSHFVIIELKKGEFKPEYAGKMNFYYSAVDDLLKHENDQPTIGLILCQAKDKIFAEYALRDIHKPIGISGYELTRALPKNLKSILPSVEEIETELSGEKPALKKVL